MRVEFHYYNASQKRWFTKTAGRAAERVSAVTSRFEYQMSDAWSAEFALHELRRTKVHREIAQQQTTITVTFAAADWQSLDSSLDNAVSQLASAVLCVVPEDIAARLHAEFIANGITRLSRLKLSHSFARADPNHHVELCFASPSLDVTEFECLYDRLDAHLRTFGFGLVDGSSWSQAGYCLDLSLSEREAGIRCSLDFVAALGHNDEVTLTDIQTGESLDRDNT